MVLTKPPHMLSPTKASATRHLSSSLPPNSPTYLGTIPPHTVPTTLHKAQRVDVAGVAPWYQVSQQSKITRAHSLALSTLKLRPNPYLMIALSTILASDCITELSYKMECSNTCYNFMYFQCTQTNLQITDEGHIYNPKHQIAFVHKVSIHRHHQMIQWP